MSTKIANHGRDESRTLKALREATQRADRAEEELDRLRAEMGLQSANESPSNPAATEEPSNDNDAGEQMLRRDSMMAHLLDSLQQGRDIGHYGRLVFAMVARHFLTDDEVANWLKRDTDFSEEQARMLLRQVEGRDYNPPKRERILEWQRQQDFPILPNADDPDCGNLYRNLKFPDSVYHHIEDYQEQKAAAE